MNDRPRDDETTPAGMQEFWPSADGWVEITGLSTPGRVHLRFLPDARGRLRVHELHIDAHEDREIRARDLRDLGLASHEGLVNSLLAESVVGSLTEPNEARRAVSPERKRRRSGKPRAGKPPQIDSHARLTELPTEQGLTDDFLRKVAAAYVAAFVRGERPNKALATDLAERYGQKPQDFQRNVERWVYNARQRGMLPPAQKGAVG